MYLLRVVPAKIPEKRNYVVDSLETVTIDNYDMRFLTELDDSVLLLEWDIAVAYHDLNNMLVHCNAAPQLIHVAPYILYPISTGLTDIHAPVWAHRRMETLLPLQMSWIDYNESVCDIFSTGMVYLPKEVVQRIGESDDLITWHHNITDSKLAFWYYHQFNQQVPVHWDVRPIHLHYDQGEFYNDRSGCRRRDSSGRHTPSDRDTLGGSETVSQRSKGDARRPGPKRVGSI